jgi:PHP family Zn ribbon phosphoesterase
MLIFPMCYLRPIVEEVVNKYLECGDLSKGFARVVCKKCRRKYLLAFSCSGRWFCPSCHQKKVLLFGENITDLDQGRRIEDILNTL